MAALIHFNQDDPFSPVIVPWGPSCPTFIRYRAGMTENTPKNTAFNGSQDPAQNHSHPPDMMALGIPAGMAVDMVMNLDASFIIRRPQVAFSPIMRSGHISSWAKSNCEPAEIIGKCRL